MGQILSVIATRNNQACWKCLTEKLIRIACPSVTVMCLTITSRATGLSVPTDLGDVTQTMDSMATLESPRPWPL